MTIKVTHPDKTTETLGPFSSDDTGGTHVSYTPSSVGTYTFQMSYPGQNLTGTNPPAAGYSAVIKAYIGAYYLPATSAIETLTVQQEPVSFIPFTPLPTNYWQTPVNAMNVNNWYAISGALPCSRRRRFWQPIQCKFKLQPLHFSTNHCTHNMDKASGLRRRAWRRIRRDTNKQLLRN